MTSAVPRRVAVLVAALLVAVLVVPALAGAATTASPAERQLGWAIDASRHLPVSATDVAAHVDPAGRGELDAAALTTALGHTGPLTLRRTLERRADTAQALVRGTSGTFVLNVETGASGLVTTLSIAPYVPSPTSWAQLDAGLARLAPRAGFAAAEIDRAGRCRLLHGVDPDRAEPLGSAFKLYVLGALGAAVSDGQAGWDERLAVRDDWKSLPSGRLQDAPAGTELTLRQYADLMISISDNTAADHLLHTVGRDAVEAQLHRFGNREVSRNTPFLTTRELFALKGSAWPDRLRSWLALGPQAREAALPGLDAVPLTAIAPWTTPRGIDDAEWFGSPSDLCRAYAGLGRQAARPAGAPIAEALSINDGGIALDRARFSSVWFKGGSEPGVLSLAYRVRTRDGRTLVAAITLANPSAAIPDAETPAALAVARGGLELAAAG